MQDVRWQQRLANYAKALRRLNDGVTLAEKRELSHLEKQGLIKSFEFTHELAWNVMKDFLTDEGVQEIFGSKSATREAFSNGLITEGPVWMDMIESRNLTSHTYNADVADDIARDIIQRFAPLFNAFYTRMRAIQKNTAGDIDEKE